MNSEFYIVLGKKIKELREERNLSQSQIGNSLGLVRSSIANIEAGRQKLLAHHLVQLSALFEISIDDLIYSKNNLDNKIDQSQTTEEIKLFLKDIVKKNIKGK